MVLQGSITHHPTGLHVIPSGNEFKSACRFEVWNAEIFTSFVHLLASLLDHLQRWPTSAKVMLTKQHCLILFQIWRHLFARIDIYSKLRVMMKTGKYDSRKSITI